MNQSLQAGLASIPVSTPPSVPHAVVLYTRAGCHLCDDALALLERCGLRPAIVDIDQDEALKARFTTCVPVVEIDVRVRFRGRVNEVLLKRVLQSGP